MKRTSRRPRRNPSPLDNPAFRRWFGTSKVVDERGEPLVVWHGAPIENLRAFREPDARIKTFSAFFFSSLRRVAASYAVSPAAVYGVYLRAEHPFVVDAGGRAWDRIRPWTGGPKPFLYARFLVTDEVCRWARRQGYDSVIFRNVIDNADYGEGIVSDIYAVFSPTQIKSATDNVGTYDPDDPSILRNPAAPTMPLYHATPQYNLDSILRRGLLRSKAGSVTLSGGGVFLTDERPLARGYAERRFGVDDYDAPWVLLKIDPRQLDPSLFEPDPGQEAELNAEDIEARGYTVSTMPWWVSLEETGQMVYAGDVPPSAIEPVEVMQPTNGDRWEPFAVQKNRHASRRPRRTSRRSR